MAFKDLPSTVFLFLTPFVLSTGRLRAEDLQTRISAAPEGSVIQLPAGVYPGPLLIDKPVTLRGTGRTVIDGAGRGTVITVRAPDVLLENLAIQNSGDSLLFEDSGIRLEGVRATVRGCAIDNVLFGIYLAKASDALIEDNDIRGKDIDISRRGDLIRLWYCDRALIRGNRLAEGRDTVLWFSDGSVVENNVIQTGRYGLHFMYTNQARVTGNVFINNSVGAYLMYSKQVLVENNRFENNRGPSGAGVGLKESDSITVSNNVFRTNRQGLFVDQSPLLAENVNRFTRNLFFQNDVGIAIMPGAKGDVFFENTFQDNVQQVSVRGGGTLDNTAWHENGRGNYWSDYADYGAAGAQVGQRPYRVEGTFENLMDTHPQSRFFLFTPAAQALEMAGRAFPLFKPQARLTDPYPLLAPPVGARESFPPFRLDALAGPGGLLVFAGLSLGFFKGKNKFNPVADAPAVWGETPVLKAKNVNKSFGQRQILKDFSCQLEPGEAVVLWGPNGAGKSTFIKCVLGLAPFEGRIELGGYDSRREGYLARQRIGYLPQDFVGYDWTVQESMEFICGVRGLDPAGILPALASCGLAGEEKKAVPALSGGMRQKLALAQALIADPALLILDEPCSNLDLGSRREFLELLKGLKGSRSLLLTSHRLEEIESLADRVLWVQEGQAPKSLTPEEFMAAVAQDFPVWIRLENELGNIRAMEVLRREGLQSTPNGFWIWVEAAPRQKMEIVRILERNELTVKDVRQESRT